MTVDPVRAADRLNRRFFIDYPLDAARKLEELELTEAVEAVVRHPVHVLAPVWRCLLPDTAASRAISAAM